MFATKSDGEQRALVDEVGAIYDSYGRGPDGMLLPWSTYCYRSRVSGLPEPPSADRARAHRRGRPRRRAARRLPLATLPSCCAVCLVYLFARLVIMANLPCSVRVCLADSHCWRPGAPHRHVRDPVVQVLRTGDGRSRVGRTSAPSATGPRAPISRAHRCRRATTPPSAAQPGRPSGAPRRRRRPDRCVPYRPPLRGPPQVRRRSASVVLRDTWRVPGSRSRPSRSG